MKQLKSNVLVVIRLQRFQDKLVVKEPPSVASLEEGALKLGADQVSFLLLLLQVIFELVCGETHLGVTAFVRGPMSTQPRVLETLGCSGSAPVKGFYHVRINTLSTNTHTFS